MQKIYNKTFSIFFLATLIFAGSVQSQICADGGSNCATITQNFNTGTGKFTSTTFTRDPANGDMRVASTVQNTSYTLISPEYALQTNGIAFVGADLTGTTAVAGNGLSNIRFSVFSGTTEIAFCNLVTPTIGVLCRSITDADLVPGTVVTYRITITTTNPANGGVGKTLVIDDFSNGSAAAPLPVQMKSFDAKRGTGNAVILNWETSSESNVKGFQIQRKSSNGSFETIAFVASKSVFGISNSPLQYDYIDINNNSGATQYRIVSVDLDGRLKMSIIRSVDGLKTLAKILVYPNPATSGPINIVFPNSNKRDIQLTDLAGTVHASWRSYNNHDLVLKMSPGNYWLSVTDVLTRERQVIQLSIPGK